jgi:hypothetical protein
MVFIDAFTLITFIFLQHFFLFPACWYGLSELPDFRTPDVKQLSDNSGFEPEIS